MSCRTALLLFTGLPLITILFFFNDTATTEIYTLSLHDALPISRGEGAAQAQRRAARGRRHRALPRLDALVRRSEEHTSELQSLAYLVCRLLLEKKKREYPRHGHAMQHICCL